MKHPSPARRVEIIAGLRALADFLVAHPELPAPNDITAQFSIHGDLTEGDAAEVRVLAEGLGTTLLADEDHRIDLWHEVARGYTSDEGSYGVRYVIHGSRPQTEDITGGAA